VDVLGASWSIGSILRNPTDTLRADIQWDDHLITGADFAGEIYSWLVVTGTDWNCMTVHSVGGLVLDNDG
jgi:hypothetical protein